MKPTKIVLVNIPNNPVPIDRVPVGISRVIEGVDKSLGCEPLGVEPDDIEAAIGESIREFGDAETASLILPRSLVVEYGPCPQVTDQKGEIKTPSLAEVTAHPRTRYVADLDGSLYKFDFRTAGLESTGYGEWRIKKIFQASSTQPVYHRAEPGVVSESDRYIYFGSNDGMIHCLRDSDGEEMWAFIPPDALPRQCDQRRR